MTANRQTAGKTIFFGCPNERTAVCPDALRWFSGLYGLKFTFACQAL